MNETPTNAAELREEIVQTRAALGETVEALAAKADIKERLHEAGDDAKRAMRARVDQSRALMTEVLVTRWRVLAGASASVVVLLVGMKLWRRYR